MGKPCVRVNKCANKDSVLPSTCSLSVDGLLSITARLAMASAKIGSINSSTTFLEGLTLSLQNSASGQVEPRHEREALWFMPAVNALTNLYEKCFTESEGLEDAAGKGRPTDSVRMS